MNEAKLLKTSLIARSFCSELQPYIVNLFRALVILFIIYGDCDLTRQGKRSSQLRSALWGGWEAHLKSLTKTFLRVALRLSLIHISEPTRRTPISYAVFCLKKKKKQ